MVAGEMRQNAGLLVGSRAVFAIIAPNRERWRSFDRKIAGKRLGTKTTVRSGRAKPSAIWAMSDQLIVNNKAFGGNHGNLAERARNAHGGGSGNGPGHTGPDPDRVERRVSAAAAERSPEKSRAPDFRDC